MNSRGNETQALLAEIKIIRSSRRTLSLEITKEAKVLVRAPYQISQSEIDRFVQEKYRWVKKHLEEAEKKLAERKAHPIERMSIKEIQELADRAGRILPGKAAYFAPVVGVTYGRITIRNQKTRWGSCSSKGNLNFNCLLMLAPDSVQDYVVVHELCHRLEMNHSPRFWSEVERVLPDYRTAKQWLKEHGEELMRKMV